jgi:cytochrome c5
MRKIMKRAGLTIGVVLVLWVAAGLVLGTIGRSRFKGPYTVNTTLPPALVTAASAQRGAHIAVSRGCTDCHADGMRGKVFLDIPIGLIIAPNLTKGRGGIGARYTSADDWDHAFRFGVRPDSSAISSFMPAWFFNRLSDEDAASLAAYLANLPPVDNELPPMKLRLPYYIDAVMAGDSLKRRLEMMQQPQIRPSPGPTAEYGRYIASTACVGCHSETMLGGPHHDPAGRPAPGLSHVGTWTRDEFARVIRTGIAPPERQLTHWMPWQKFAGFNEDEVTALYEYLKTISAVRTTTSR